MEQEYLGFSIHYSCKLVLLTSITTVQFLHSPDQRSRVIVVIRKQSS